MLQRQFGGTELFGKWDGMGYAVTLFCPLPGVQRDDA